MILFSQYIQNVPLSVPISYDKAKGKIVFEKIYIFRLFPVLLTILFMWIVCVILTVTDVLPEGDFARADANLDLIKKVKWFRIPYPCEYYLSQCVERILNKTAKAINETFTGLKLMLQGFRIHFV